MNEAEPKQEEIKILQSRIEEVSADFDQATEARFNTLGFDKTQSYHFSFALREIVLNAIIHGNLGMPSKRGFEGDYDAEIRRREALAENLSKTVTVTWNMNQEEIVIMVTDEGPGFDRKSVPDELADENLLKEGQKGLSVVEGFLGGENVSFERGKTILRIKKHPPSI